VITVLSIKATPYPWYNIIIQKFTLSRNGLKSGYSGDNIL
jgi:hypothetical protein